MADKKTDLQKWDSEWRPLASGEILHAPPEELSSGEAVEAFAIVKWVGELASKRKEELRLKILEDEDIISSGKPTPKGGTVTSVRGNKVQRRKTVKHFANLSRIREVLQAKGIPEEKVFDTVVRRVEDKVLNPSKMENLANLGVLSPEDLESMHVVQWTLVVDPSDRIQSVLEQAEDRASAQRNTLFGKVEDDDL